MIPISAHIGASYRVATRRGSAYIIVLSTVLLVAVAGVSGVIAVREQRRSVEMSVEVDKARFIAQSAMELAESQLQNTTSYRSGITSGTVVSSRSIAGGTMRVAAADPSDSNIGNSTLDDVVLTATGVYGNATQIYQRRFKPSTTPLDSLSVSAYAGTNLSFSSATVRAYGVLGCAGTATALFSNVWADVEAGVLATGLTFRQGTQSLAPTRTLPTSTDALAAYLAMGTQINFSSLSSGGEIRDTVLGPGRNPFGAANAAGVYYINCGNQSITIRNARISGTLVLVNTGSGSSFTKSVLLEAATPGYPALLVNGDMTLNMDSTDLSEGSANMNPSGAPYQGLADSDTTDKYPSMISGLVYVSGNLTINGSTTIYGPVLCAKAISFGGTPVLYPVTPGPTPPGFSTAGGFAPVSGSWARVTN